MNSRLADALPDRRGVGASDVLTNPGGEPKNDGQMTNVVYRLCRLAGLQERAWHILRHSFATHAARFGVIPWTLMTWMGHKRIDETMRYVNLANAHARPIPKEVLAAGKIDGTPEQRIMEMLRARGNLTASEVAQVAQVVGI